MQLSFQLSLQVCSLYFSCNIAASIEGNNERFLFSKTQKRELALLLHLKSPPSFQICHFCIKKKGSLWSLKLHVTAASALFHCLPEHSLTPSKVYIMGRPDLQGLTCSPPFVMRGQRLPRWSRLQVSEAKKHLWGRGRSPCNWDVVGFFQLLSAHSRAGVLFRGIKRSS